jgi:hypothetical protein
MKVLVKEVEGQGLLSLIGKNVILFCMNYIYSGMLVGVNDTDVILEDAGIVYETGELSAKSFKDFQRFGVAEHRIRTSAIESYGERAK